MRQTILVTGATGAQGGSVARHLIADNNFQVRVFTRNPESENARELEALGAEIAVGDLSDLGSINKALEGCYAAFGVTNFWEHFGGEYQQGVNLIDAVAKSDVQHFVFSTLPSATKVSNGEIAVPHLDIKAELEAYSKSLNLPATYVHIAFYYENFLSYFPPQKVDANTFQFGFPQGSTPLAAVSVEDLGGVVKVIFNNPERFLHKTVGVVGDDLPCSNYAEILSEGLGKKIDYSHYPREIYASFGFPGAEEIANMFAFNEQYIPERKAELAESRILYPQIRTLKQWLSSNTEKFAPFFQ